MKFSGLRPKEHDLHPNTDGFGDTGHVMDTILSHGRSQHEVEERRGMNGIRRERYLTPKLVSTKPVTFSDRGSGTA